MFGQSPPTDQRAGTRPISFLLEDAGSLSQPVTLAVRPEDLTRTESTRATVHQTLGREPSGWVDFFGEGLPSVTIAGHTGWRASAGGAGLDGFGSFEALNQLVQHDFAAAKQNAINRGADPGSVKLIFVDMLDNFVWSVTPQQFVLRRSKSRPLLYQYNIALQAISTRIDNPLMVVPFLGSITGGLDALGRVIAGIEGFASSIIGMVNRAVSFVDSGLMYVSGIVHRFTTEANRVLGAVNGVVGSVTGGFTRLANRAIEIAYDLASVGRNTFRTLSNIRNLPSDLRTELGRVSSAFNEVACIFKNSLRPRKTYDNYDGLYGASNCSSTTGGRPASQYASSNPFSLLQPERDPVTLSSAAQSSMVVMKRSDPVLAPMTLPEMARHLELITDGVTIGSAA